MSLEFGQETLNETLRTKNESLFVEVESLRKRQKESLLLPEIEGLSVAGFNLPAENVSGDGYGIVEESGKSKFYIFDVTSHGLSTSIDWGMAHAMFNFAARSGMHPIEAIYDIEYHLDKMTGHHIVPVTAIYGEIDKNGDMSYVHAGHTRPLFYSRHLHKVLPDNDVVIKEGKGNGRALNTGTEEPSDIYNSEHNYYSHKIRLEKGDFLVLYSDGITESRNKYGYCLEEWGLIDIINQVVYFNEQKMLTAGDIVAEIKAYLSIFFEGTKIEDDCSLMVLLSNRETE